MIVWGVIAGVDPDAHLREGVRTVASPRADRSRRLGVGLFARHVDEPAALPVRRTRAAATNSAAASSGTPWRSGRRRSRWYHFG